MGRLAGCQASMGKEALEEGGRVSAPLGQGGLEAGGLAAARAADGRLFDPGESRSFVVQGDDAPGGGAGVIVVGASAAGVGGCSQARLDGHRGGAGLFQQALLFTLAAAQLGVAVEDHGDAAQEVAADGRDLDAAFVTQDEAGLDEALQALEFVAEVFLRVDEEAVADGLEVELALAHEFHDDGTL